MQMSAVSLVHSSRRKIPCHPPSRTWSGRKTAWPSFTLFEARGINSSIVVYSECMHVDGRPAL